jgi:hypothetical protein
MYLTFLIWLYVKYLTSIDHMFVCPSPVEVSKKLGTVTIRGLTGNEDNNEGAKTADRLF